MHEPVRRWYHSFQRVNLLKEFARLFAYTVYKRLEPPSLPLPILHPRVLQFIIAIYRFHTTSIYKMLFILVALIISSTLAQRPDNATYCDYYAERKYGANDSDAQFQLIQSIVVLAFGGGFNLSNYTSNLTGILNPGTYLNPETHEYLGVDLHPWFDGSLDTTNSNGYALGVNWLDGGGLDPLYDYTRGAASNLDVRNNTNQQYSLSSVIFPSL